jgi:hypothetical protein
VGGARRAAACVNPWRRGCVATAAATTSARTSSKLGPCILEIPTARSSGPTRYTGLGATAATGSGGVDGPLVIPLGNLIADEEDQ